MSTENPFHFRPLTPKLDYDYSDWETKLETRYWQLKEELQKPHLSKNKRSEIEQRMGYIAANIKRGLNIPDRLVPHTLYPVSAVGNDGIDMEVYQLEEATPFSSEDLLFIDS